MIIKTTTQVFTGYSLIDVSNNINRYIESLNNNPVGNITEAVSIAINPSITPGSKYTSGCECIVILKTTYK